ncbi:PAS domain S-box protein [Pantanalinema rosaneae CENA516]|uniref:PAS domain S-box protein n=1 Tax=Pantanalinema rosaneae TaxID=1620701 RepID=UPI003D6E5694
MSLDSDHELHTQIQYRLIEQLSASEQRYRELVENLYEIVFETNAAGYLTFVNHAWVEHLGYEITESLGLTIDHFLYPDDRALSGLVPPFEQSQPIKGQELRFCSKAQEIVWLELSARVRSEQGLLGSLVNITERKRVETALRQSEEQYRSVVANLKEVIFQTDAAGIWTFLNPAWSEITGFSLEESLGRSFLDFVHPDDRQLNLDRFQPLIARRKEYCRHEIRYLKKRGGFCWIEVFARLLLDVDGNVIGTSGTLNDVTERQQAQEAVQLQFQQAQLLSAIAQRIRQSLNLNEILNTTVTEIRQLFHTDRVLLYRLEPDLSGTVIVESIDSPWTSLLGRRIIDTCFMQERCLNPYQQGRIQAVSDIHRADLPECYMRMLAQFQVRANLVVPILQAQYLWGLLIVQHCSAPRTWQPWEIELLQQLVIQVGFAIQQSQLYEQLQIELSQREFALHELQQAQEQIQASLHEKEVLLKEIHHRVKNNLLVVSSLLEWQTDYMDDPALIRMVGESQSRIQSMALIHEKLYQSQSLAQINLGEYVETLVNQLQASFNLITGTVNLHFDLDSILLNIETITPCGLIISELVSNVFEHAFPDDRDKHLWLSAKKLDHCLSITVKDNGIGLPQDFNICNTESMGFQLICLLTQQLEGEIRVTQDHGAVFTLIFSELNYCKRL